MGPSLSVHDHGYLRLVYPKLQSDHFLRSCSVTPGGANEKNSLVAQLCRLILLAALRPWNAFVAPFVHAILLVDKIVAKKKVRRIDAGSIIAAVQNVLAGRDGSLVEYPRNAVRKFRLSVVTKLGISVLARSTLPRPTLVTVSNFRFRKKSLQIVGVRHG